MIQFSSLHLNSVYYGTGLKSHGRLGTHYYIFKSILAYWLLGSRVLREKLSILRLVKKFPAFVYAERVCQQQPDTCPDSEPDRRMYSSFSDHIFKFQFNATLPFSLILENLPLLSVF
jgi:hypothetical protein